MKKYYFFLSVCTALFLGGMVLPALAQDSCTASAGHLALADSVFCPQEDVLVSVRDHNTALTTEFVLTDTSGFILMTGNTEGRFADLPLGSYKVFALNLDPSNPPAEGPEVGRLISEITDPAVQCFDLSTAVTFAVADTTAPVARCRTDVTVFLNTDGQVTMAPADLDQGSSDDCGITDMQIDQEILTCTQSGILSMVLTVTDAAGLTDRCTTFVDLRDTLPPVARCRNSFPVFLDSDGVARLSTSAIDNGSYDNCADGLSLSLSHTTFSCTDLGVREVSLTARDESGQTQSCSTNVSVIDTLPPVARCQDIPLSLNAEGTASLDPAQIDFGSSDNCELVSIRLDRDEFTCTDQGAQQVVLTVEDRAGRTDTCKARVTLSDDQPPQARCQPLIRYGNDAGAVTVLPADIDAGSSDNCQLVHRALNRTVFGCGDLGLNSIMLTVTDDAGQQDSCTTTIQILDSIPPSPSCRSAMAYLDEAGQVMLTADQIDAGSSDNCRTIADRQLSPAVFFCDDQGEQNVLLRVEDPSGNAAECTSIVTVVDTLSPRAICRDVTLYLNDRGIATLPADTLDGGSWDNCSGPLSFRLDQSRFTCGDAGPQTVQLTVSDPQGNQNTCTAAVVVRDTLPATPQCRPVTLYLDESGEAILTPSQVDNNSTDNCGLPADRQLSKTRFTCTDAGLQNVALILTDQAGNMAACTTSVTVIDSVPPRVRCRDFTLEVGINGAATLTPDLINDQSMDNCGGPLLFSLSRRQFTCADLGPNLVTLYGTDASNLIDSCTSRVTVVDSKAPVARTQNMVLYLDENGFAELDPQALNNGSTDNCTIVQYEADRTQFTCADLGDQLVSLTLTDVDGNQATEPAVVTIRDTIAPVMNCPQPLTVTTSADGGVDCQFILDDQRLDPMGLTDNCGVTTLTHDYPGAPFDSTLLGASFPVGTHRITWTLRDGQGQQRACTVTMTIQDDEAPIARCRDTVLVRLSSDGFLPLDSFQVDLGSSDNCGITTYQLSRTNFDCSDVGFHDITVEMADASGNRASCAVTVGVMASPACPQPVVTNADGPDINDPCSCRGDGAFDEQVVVGPTTPGQVWTVKETNLLNPATLQPYAVGTPLVEVSLNASQSIYVIDGVHMDGVGYTLTAESPLYLEDLTIHNTCYYPKPEILGLEGPICRFTAPIPLVGTGGAGVSGTGSFTINGQPATELDPGALGVGTHTIAYTFDAGNPADQFAPNNVACPVTITEAVTVIETPDAFACNDLVTITTNAGCEILILPQMILSGNYLCYDDYEVFLSYQGQPVPNPVPAAFTGLRLRTLIQHKPSGRICFGNIELVDVQGPQVASCAPDIRGRFVCTDLDRILNNPETIDPESALFTGRPDVEDNCSGTTLTFQDQLVNLDDCAGAQETAYIRRRFFAEDQFGNVSTCDQLIYFQRPDTLFFPVDTMIVTDCTEDPLPTDPSGNLSADLSGRPYYLNGFGERVPVGSDDASCGYAAVYTDTRINLCAGQYTVLRAWRLFDYCAGRTTDEHTQRIEVGDFAAPVVQCPQVDLDRDGLPDARPVFSTDPGDCTAAFTIPQPAVFDCSDYTVTTQIYSWVPQENFGFPTGDTLFQELPGAIIAGGVASGVTTGEHYFVYTVTDDCGQTTRDTCVFEVRDQISPTVFCDDDLVVSIGSSGQAFVLPLDIDEGTRDNCTPRADLSFRLRRLLPAECQSAGTAGYTDWQESIEVNCCDVGRLVTLEMQVVDEAGNTNVCVSRLRVEDKVRPQCIAPIDLEVDCNDLPADFDPSNKAELQRRFGLPEVTDNCGEDATWEELDPQINLDDCGFGTIVRSFRTMDGFGNSSLGACQQEITVEPVHQYTLRFPEDVSVSCAEPDIPGVLFEEQACDLLAVRVRSDTFFAAIAGCYKVHRTYEVINWCAYDGISEPVILPRNADCDDTPGDEALWVIVRPDGEVFLDRDDDPENTWPAAGTRPVTCDGNSNPEGYWVDQNAQPGLRSRGYWQYTQHIAVYDNIAPVIQASVPEPFCSTDKVACTGTVDLGFSVLETCTAPEDLKIEVRFDAGRDGDVDELLPRTSLRGQYPDYRIAGVFPIGNHALSVSVTDGCGNQALREIPFVVADCQITAPICINSLSVELGALEQDQDIDGDGEVDLASARIAALDFVVSPAPDCSGAVTYSINRQGAEALPEQDSLLLTCADEGTLLVEIHTWDTAGNQDFCLTALDVQNNGDVCTDIPEGEIMGQVLTEAGTQLPYVLIRLSGSQNKSSRTDGAGNYRFAALEEGGDYSLIPLLDEDPRNGVSTFDLILIRKHILGMSLLNSPYKLIAADVNNSGTITVLDMIQLQRLILGYTTEFRENRSWRFVDAGHVFTNPQNPWSSGFPEVVNINNLGGQISGADFVAIKIGDVNHTMRLPGLADAQVRSLPRQIGFPVIDRLLQPGEVYEFGLYLPDEPLEGYQFTLEYDPQEVTIEKVVHGLAGPEQFGYFPEEGLLTTHWYRTEVVDQDQQRLFTLRLRARKAKYVSELLQLSSRLTPAEAYRSDGTLLVPELAFRMASDTDHFVLYPNLPNPFREETRVRFYLPRATRGQLTVFDGQGRVLRVWEDRFEAGLQEMRLQGAGLPTGVLYYRFQSPEYQATRKMILLE